MVTLTVFGAIIVTMQVLKLGRSEDDLAVKLNRGNFPVRCMAVQRALEVCNSYAEAVEFLKARSWFTDNDADELAAGLEAAVDNLAIDAATMNVPIHGMIAAKAEPSTPVTYDEEVEAEVNEIESQQDNDIPI